MKPIANWKEANEYQKLKTASLARLAWEFLRRNSGYQKDWEEYLQLCRKIIPEFDPCDWRQYRFALLDHPDYVRYDPPRLDRETEGEWTRRTGGQGRFSLHHWYVKEWGLITDFLPDPFRTYASSFYWRLFETPPRQLPCFTMQDSEIRFCEPQLKEGLVLEFDLSAPIQPQIVRAKSILLSSQKLRNCGKTITKRKTEDMYPWYLRTLDARSAGITDDKEIVEAFSKEVSNAIDVKTLINWENAACSLRDGGYRDLVKAPPEPTKKRPSK